MARSRRRGLTEMAAVMLERFTSRNEDGTLTVVDSAPDDLIGVRGSDPVDNALPSARARPPRRCSSSANSESRARWVGGAPRRL
ncbi:hypothetical protein IOD13_18825 [Brevibacterium casei]|nr:hypothetical protein [Brevibacterium casei]